MAGKIGVYFDQQNIGGGLDVEALAAQTAEKWGDLTAVVKVVPVLALALDEIKADIEAQGLDGVLLCGASPRVDGELYRLPVLIEHVNLREQCVQAYKNPDKSPVDTAKGAPELLQLMARDYVNMGVVKLQKSEAPEAASVQGVQRILVIGGGWTGLTAALEAAATGYEVVLVEKSDKLGGAANNIPMASPLASPWENKQPTNLVAKVSEAMGSPKIKIYTSARMQKLEGQPGELLALLGVGRLQQGELGELGVVAIVLLVLGGVHFRVVSRNQDQAAVDAGVGEGEQRIRSHVDPHVLHGHQSAPAAERGADADFQGHLLVGRPG